MKTKNQKKYREHLAKVDTVRRTKAVFRKISASLDAGSDEANRRALRAHLVILAP